MADSSPIREFLISLGFKLDQPALKSFQEGVTKATKAVVGLAAAVEGTATIVAAGVARFASNLEDLYFAAQRTGSSATGLMAFQRTAQNFGASAEEARGSVEGLAQALRMNPGNAGLLQSLGVHLKRSKDGTYDATDALMQFGNAMRARGYFQQSHFYMAEQYGQMFGISERTLLALKNGDFGREFARIQQEMRGNGFDKAARDAHSFMMSLRDLETQLQVFGAQIEDALQKKLGINLKQLDAWIQKNGPALAKELVTNVLLIVSAAEWLGHKLLELIGWLQRLDKSTHGWSTRLLEMLAIMRMVGGFEIIGGVIKLTAAFVRLGSAIMIASRASSGLSALGLLGKGGAVGLAGVGAYEGASALSTWLGKKLGLKTDLGSAFGGWLYDTTHRSAEALAYFQSQGWSKLQAAGIVANLSAESGLGAGARGDAVMTANGVEYGAYGLAQWHKDRQAKFQQRYGHSMQSGSYQEQLDFVQWELTHTELRAGNALKAATSAAAAARAVSLYYERPAGGIAEANRRAAAAVNISQQTDIHVHGQKDPHAIAREVRNAQTRVNADVVRNFSALVR
ncbi:MAG TPA: phage tail tip lysozyme [Steroidobacteraceae bacterium]|jgi:hypothetical protein|nr:phage tail tip lysozyme [Steroidobacteraceae bacterium]